MVIISDGRKCLLVLGTVLHCVEERKSGDLSNLYHSKLPSKKAMKQITMLFPQSKQSPYKSQFLQELSCQKPYWDQARLCSLVNKQVVHYTVKYCTALTKNVRHYTFLRCTVHYTVLGALEVY